jgi:hypothetical protein
MPTRTGVPNHRRSAGGCNFALDPELRADSAPLTWLPHLDPAAVVVGPAPETFGDACSLSRLTPLSERRAVGGDHWLVDDAGERLPVVLTNGASATTPAAVVIPLDADFAARADAAARLWRFATGRPRRRSPDRLTRQQRQRLSITLRVLDGRLAGETYRAIAQALFGAARVPAGPGWKTHDLRDRTIRLARAGLKLMQGGYLDLLRYPQQRE